MYVVGLKAYDKFCTPIRNIYTYVKGPFLSLEEAQEACEKVSIDIFNNYSMAFPPGTSFLIKEKEDEITIYQLTQEKQCPLITLSSLFFDTQKLEREKPNTITKELREEACKRLATLLIK